MRRASQEAFTLVELTLAIAIMGILFVAVFTGLSTFFAVTASQRSTADLDAIVRQYVEQLSGPATPYVTSCPASYSFSFPGGYALVAPATVTYWDGSVSTSPFAFDANCAAHNGNGLQRVSATIRHTLSGGKTQDQVVTFLKRKTA